MSEAPPHPRTPVGWIVLGLLFAYMVFSATTGEPAQDARSRSVRYSSRLRTAIANYQAGDNPLVSMMTGEKSPDGALRKIVRDAAPRRRTDSVEAAAWGVARRALGESVEKEVLARLVAAKDAPLVEALRGDKVSNPRSLANRLRARGPISKVMAEEVLREGGLSGPGGASSAMVGGIVVLFFASGTAWVAALLLWGSGKLHTLGPAFEARSGGEADLLALRAAKIFAAFFALQLVAALVVRASGLDGRAGQALAFGGMLVVVPVVLRRGPSMAEIGLSGRNLGRNVLLGLWAFLLELPVTFTIAIVCSSLLRGLPAPEHPASSALLGSPDVWTILATFFGGAIIAPFWEETMFRGLLFPALRQVLRGPVPAVLLSSFFFASIHPQGPVLWAALASVALFSCFVAQTTRSLVPSVVMHFAHNATLLALTVAMGR